MHLQLHYFVGTATQPAQQNMFNMWHMKRSIRTFNHLVWEIEVSWSILHSMGSSLIRCLLNCWVCAWFEMNPYLIVNCPFQSNESYELVILIWCYHFNYYVDIQGEMILRHKVQVQVVIYSSHFSPFVNECWRQFRNCRFKLIEGLQSPGPSGMSMSSKRLGG